MLVSFGSRLRRSLVEPAFRFWVFLATLAFLFSLPTHALPEHVGGQWGPVLLWPHVAVSMANLPDGRILTYASNEPNSFPGSLLDEYTHAAVWDPETGSLLDVPHPSHDMFCAAMVTLESGETFVMGGRNQGDSPWVSYYDFHNDQWIQFDTSSDMNRGRWYATAVYIGTGEVLIAAGVGGGVNPERWTPGGDWTLLTGIDLTDTILELDTRDGSGSWPLLQLDKTGKIFHHGATTTMNTLDPFGGPQQLGTITDLGTHFASDGVAPDWFPDEGVSVLYDEGKILVAGGSTSATNNTAVANAFTIDINGPAPVMAAAASMNSPRQFQNEVMLPTGDVLVVGGNTNGNKFTDTSAVMDAEAWDPDTDTWTLWNAQDQARAYHSTALLLLDGRVISGGGGLGNGNCPGGIEPPPLPGDCEEDHWNAEVFSPPYLFNTDSSLATRPQILDVPKVLRVGRTFTLQATPGLSGFSMVRMSATTHTMNTDQRFLRPSVVETAPGSYDITLHSNQHVLVPGYWMLFALDGEVPSVAKAIQIVNDGTPRGPPISGLRHDLGEEVLYQVEATDPDGNALTFTDSGLPPGLSLDAATGIVSGTTTQAGLFNVTVMASDGSEAANIAFQWVVSTETSESGSVLVSQANSTEWHSVNLTNSYEKPVVVMGPPSFGDTEPTTVRVRNATPTGFEFQLQEWDYQDGVHGTEEISYLVVEAGEYLLPGGGALVAGISTGIDFENPWTQPFTPGVFSQTPLVLAQVATTLGTSTLAPRLEAVTTTEFVVKLQEEEAGDQLFPAEDVHWIAVEPALIADLLEGAITGTVVDEVPESIAYSLIHGQNQDQGFSSVPHLLASMQTAEGADPAALRYDNASPTGFEVFVEEEQSGDSEVDHADEEVGWLAIDPAVTTLGLLPFFNQPPSVISPENQANFRDDVVSLFVQALDPEGGVLTFSATDLPAGLSMDPNTGEIAGTIAASALYNPTITATDPSDDTGEVSFLWTVGDPLEVFAFPTPPALQGTNVDYSAPTNPPGNYQYDWDFGDGTPPVGVSGSPDVSHTFASPDRYIVTLTVEDLASSQTFEHQFVQNITAPKTPQPPTASSSILYEASNDRVWAVNPDNNSVAVIDALTNTKLVEIAVSADPRTLAVAGDGRIWVACSDAAAIDIIDSSTLAVVQSLDLPDGSEPYGVVFNPAGTEAFVTLSGAGQVLRLDGVTGAELASQNIGQHVRHLGVTADGSSLWISRFVTPLLPGEESGVPTTQGVGGEVLNLDATTLASATTVLSVSLLPDSEQSARGVPNYLGALAISPDGGHLLVPSKQDNVLRGGFRDVQDLTHDTSVRAILSRVDLGTGLEEPMARLDHDNASIASATIFSQNGAYALTALEGNREVAVVDPFTHFDLGRVTTGRAPHGLVLSPDGGTLYVDDFMDRTVSVYDLNDLLDFDDTDLPLLATVPKVALEALTPEVLNGKQLFYDAMDPRMALESYMACAACHNDGGHDGRVWDFTDLGEGLRNTIGLRGHGAGHGPLHWTANFDEVQDFEGQIRHFGGTGLMSDPDFAATSDPLGAPKMGLSGDLDDLAAYLGSLQTSGASPLRASDGSFTPEALAGRGVFAAQGCGLCHGGAAFSDSALGLTHDVGTLKVTSGPQTALDTPTTRGLWRTAPYLHDGSAPTLLDAVRAHLGVSLTPAEEASLVAYLDQIDDAELLAPNGAPLLSIESPLPDAIFTVGNSVSFTGTATDPEDGDLTSAIAWTSSLDGSLGSGGSLNTSALSFGQHVISADVTDSAGEPGAAQITITVNPNGAPSLNITAPADGTSMTLGDAVLLVGTASDPEDGDLTAGIAWSSDLSGPLGTGGSVSTTALGLGQHVITASVTDSGGEPGSAQITITVNPNGAPSLNITAPADGTSATLGDAVLLVGTASDPEDGDLTAGIAWSSDVSGPLGIGGSVSTTALGLGQHVIMASVTDSGGEPGSAQISVTVDPNGLPSVTISAPLDGTNATLGDTVLLVGTASDPEDGDLTAAIAWSSDLSGPLGTGGSVSTTALGLGQHVITASATDSGGEPGSAQISVTVDPNGLPSVTISAPLDGTNATLGDTVLLVGTASDPEDGDLTESIAWTSDLSGPLGIGGSVSTTALGLGQHVITASVTDSGGEPGSAQITITVNPNGAPSLNITAPADGTSMTLGDAVLLVGTASDPEDGDLTAAIAWSSDVSGPLGTGGSVSTTALGLGQHVITASVTDSGGEPGSAQITITVNPNGAPSLNITAPADGTSMTLGDAVLLVGTASDPEDGDLTAAIAWSSDLSGPLGTGGSVSTTALGLGQHVITARATDSGGEPGSAQITITVNPNGAPSLNITAPADGTSATLGDAVLLVGTASDPEDGDLTAGIAWSSDLSGPLGIGGSVSTTALGLGQHVITARATDSGGEPGSAQISVTVDPNALPSVTISAPLDGTNATLGDTVLLVGTASDPEDGDLTESIAWSSDLSGPLGTGGSVSTTALGLGQHVITASATDSGGEPGSAQISVTVDPNALPSVTISAPLDGTNATLGDTVLLVGTASDPEDGDLTESIAWTSDLSGPLGLGGSVSTTALGLGQHVITASVTDSGGEPGSAQITITVNPNGAPSLNITAPADGTSMTLGDAVLLVGTASDPEDGDLTAAIAWSSDVSGPLGTGGSVSTTALGLGQHVITASATDSGGEPGSAQSSVTVNSNALPSVTISAPPDGTSVTLGDAVLLVGTALDPEDGVLTATIAWTSDLSGALGSGGSVSTTALGLGEHVITASVIDSGGEPGSAQIRVTVNPNGAPSLNITAPADGTSVTLGDTVLLLGTASDPEDGDLTAAIAWSSDLFGPLGTGGSVSATALGLGQHVITASVTDSGGEPGSAQITVAVNPNAPPTVTITSPAGGSTVALGDPVNLTGVAMDPEEGDLTSSLAWTSDLDGALGSGGSVMRDDLSEGTHLLSADVSDGASAPGHAEVVLVVPEPGMLSTLVAGFALLTALGRTRRSRSSWARSLTQGSRGRPAQSGR